MKVPDQTKFKDSFELGNSGPPCAESDIAEFEKSQRLRLPKDFRDFLLQHNGGLPKPDCITTKGVGRVLRRFFPCSKLWCGDFPGVVQFGDDMGGNKFAISCRGTDYGCVYYIDHEETNPDEFSVRLTASARIMPTFFAKGVVRLATKFSDFIRQLHFTREDWVKHLLNTDFVHFQAFVEDAGLDYTDDIGTPLINLVASYGTLRDLEWLYRKGARAEKIVCHAVRNTREPVPMIRFLLDSGEDGAAFFKEGLPYPMGYAKRNNLRDIVAVLREYNVADSPSL